MKFPQEYTDDGLIILDDLNEKKMNDPRVQAKFKRSRHNNSSIFIISQDYYELPKKTVRTIGKKYHIFKSNNFGEVQNLYQGKASIDMTLKEFNYLISTCWDKQYQPLSIDMTKDKFLGRFRLGLNNISILDTSPLHIVISTL